MSRVRKAAYSGRMSGGSMKKLTRAITVMAMAFKPRTIYNPHLQRYISHHLSFITLTIAAHKNISARDAYNNCLAPFLQWMRRDGRIKYGDKYLWKVENQKRGQIHYHIITPAWIDKTRLQEKWNELLHKHRYTDEYAKAKGHFKAPSARIEAVHKKQNTAGYLAKAIIAEMAKAVDARELEIRKEVRAEIEAGTFDVSCDPEYLEDWEARRRIYEDGRLNGKTWDCCDDLAGVKYFTIPLTPDHVDLLDQLRLKGGIREKGDEYWTLVMFRAREGPRDLLDRYETKEMNRYFESLLN